MFIAKKKKERKKKRKKNIPGQVHIFQIMKICIFIFVLVVFFPLILSENHLKDQSSRAYFLDEGKFLCFFLYMDDYFSTSM